MIKDPIMGGILLDLILINKEELVRGLKQTLEQHMWSAGSSPGLLSKGERLT